MTDRSTAAGIEAVGLSREFGSVVALDRVDLRVEPGESVSVFGPNGAGKTTLLRLLSLGLKPGGGSLRIGGLEPRKDDRRIRQQIGLISHQSFLYDDLTAEQNLEFFARLYGVGDPRRRSRELLELFGIALRADDPVGTFSRGMQQRLSLARALVHDPPFVFLDEPFTGLDPLAADLLRSILGELREQGRTVVLVTHNLRQGLELADRWIILSHGRIAGSGIAAETDGASFEATYAARLDPSRRPAEPA